MYFNPRLNPLMLIGSCYWVRGQPIRRFTLKQNLTPPLAIKKSIALQSMVGVKMQTYT
jgi:hypothetical protein